MKPQGVVVEATEYIIETKVKDFQTDNRSARVHQEGGSYKPCVFHSKTPWGGPEVGVWGRETFEARVSSFLTKDGVLDPHPARNVWEVHYYAGWSAAGQRKPTARFPTKRGALHSARRWVRENK
jgi:hypothetical protein